MKGLGIFTALAALGRRFVPTIRVRPSTLDDALPRLKDLQIKAHKRGHTDHGIPWKPKSNGAGRNAGRSRYVPHVGKAECGARRQARQEARDGR